MTSEHESMKPLVLLVDDSIDVHRLLIARLKHEHFDLVTSLNGPEALKIAREKQPSAILLDLDMPGMDGFEVIRQLKDEPTTHNIPVLVLSGLQGSEDKVTAFELGATDYVTKPFDLSELRARLRASLRLDRLLRLLAERANVDGLTGLGNRAHFDKRWAEEVAECERYSRPLSLALIDIDHFKQINDTFGHPAGDEVLQGLAQIIQKQCRSSDVPCRFGGEEFAIIMPSSSTDDAVRLAERIADSVRKSVWDRHPDRPITISIGIAGTAGAGAVEPEAWIEHADKNLYEAKNTGRDRVVSTELDHTQLRITRRAG